MIVDNIPMDEIWTLVEWYDLIGDYVLFKDCDGDFTLCLDYLYPDSDFFIRAKSAKETLIKGLFEKAGLPDTGGNLWEALKEDAWEAFE